MGHPGKLLPRIACLQVPELPLCALLRARPDLHDRPLAVTEGPGRAARVFAATEEAEAVRPGMTAAQAQTVCPELELYPADPELVRQAHAALLDLAHAFSPRVESGPAGLAYLEATGLFPVFGPEANLVARIQEAAGRLDLGMRVGLASGKGVARTAAQEADATGGRVIPPGQEAAFLAPLPLSRLLAAADLESGQRERLRSALRPWGLRTAGELARLERAAVGRRLGATGVTLHCLACGQEQEAFAPQPVAPVFVERLDLDEPLAMLEPLLFVLRRLLDRLDRRLGARGLAARRLDLELVLESRQVVRRVQEVAAPTRDTAGLLALLRLDLERAPPESPVAGVELTVQPAAPRPSQADLFLPAGPAPLSLASTLARLAALLGPGRIGAPALVDARSPEAFTLRDFQPPAARPGTLPSGPDPETPRLVFRTLRPPRPARVRLRDQAPVHVRATGLRGRVRVAAGPWRLQERWWSQAERVDREEWDVELEGGDLIRLVRDGVRGGWFVEGEYD